MLSFTTGEFHSTDSTFMRQIEKLETDRIEISQSLSKGATKWIYIWSTYMYNPRTRSNKEKNLYSLQVVPFAQDHIIFGKARWTDIG